MLVHDANNLLFQCRRWPDAPALVDRGVPDVPVLVLEGLEDTRTPLEVGERVAARFPQAQVVRVPKTAHAVVGRRKCARTALGRFLAGRPVGDPCANARGGTVLPLPPRTVAEAGGAVPALLATLDDLVREAGVRFSDPMRGGGLRGGWFAIRRGTTVAVHRFAFVRGLAISGTVDAVRYAGRLTVRGVRGTIAISRTGLVTGTLGGRRIRVSWRPPKPLL